MLPNFLKKDKDSILFNIDGELVFYVPESFFESKYAVIEGEYVTILGLLRYEVFNEKGKSVTGLKDFTFPSSFTTRPSEIKKIKHANVGGDIDDYRIMSYNKGDQVIVSTKVPQLTENIEAFFKLFMSGKQPKNIPYNQIQDLFLECAKLNGMNYGVTTQIIGVAISELYRDPKDLSKPYRLSPNFDNKNYKPINILEIPKYTSPYTAFNSQNFDDALVSSMVNKKDTYSPLEKLVTG